MNEQMLKDVLEDVLAELKEANRSLMEMGARMNVLEGKVGGFEQKLDEQQVIVDPPNLAPLLDMIREQGNILRKETAEAMGNMRTEMTQGIRALSEVVESQPKPIVRQWRLSLFPEWDSGNWKHFINWLFGATLGALVVGALFLLGREYMARVHPVQVPAVTVAPSAPAGSGLPPLHTTKTREKRSRKERIPTDSLKMP